MDNLDQLNVIKDFTDVIDSLGISYLIGGSIASSLHGIVRFTEDADITVEPFDAKANDFIDSLKGRYYISSDAMNQALLNRTSFNAIHIETAFKIDVFVQKNNPFDNQMMEHSSPTLTNKIYTNVDPVLRHAVEQLPVNDWL